MQVVVVQCESRVTAELCSRPCDGWTFSTWFDSGAVTSPAVTVTLDSIVLRLAPLPAVRAFPSLVCCARRRCLSARLLRHKAQMFLVRGAQVVGASTSSLQRLVPPPTLQFAGLVSNTLVTQVIPALNPVTCTVSVTGTPTIAGVATVPMSGEQDSHAVRGNLFTVQTRAAFVPPFASQAWARSFLMNLGCRVRLGHPPCSLSRAHG